MVLIRKMERIEQQILVKNLNGLHVRPASVFVQAANKFDSSVHLEIDGSQVDGKSIIAILSLGIHRGMQIKIIVEGPDAKQAFEELRSVLENENG